MQLAHWKPRIENERFVHVRHAHKWKYSGLPGDPSKGVQRYGKVGWSAQPILNDGARSFEPIDNRKYMKSRMILSYLVAEDEDNKKRIKNLEKKKKEKQPSAYEKFLAEQAKKQTIMYGGSTWTGRRKVNCTLDKNPEDVLEMIKDAEPERLKGAFRIRCRG